jgi:Ca2+-binding RTX toxin-like protein
LQEGERLLPSTLDALILKDAYGYDVMLPHEFGTFYAHPGSWSGDDRPIVVTAGPDDTVTVSRVNDFAYEISVTLANPVDGTVPGATWSSYFSPGLYLPGGWFSNFNWISIYGGKVVNLWEIPTFTRVNAPSAHSQTVNVGHNGSLDWIGGSVEIAPSGGTGGGNVTLNIDGSADGTPGRTVTITDTQISGLTPEYGSDPVHLIVHPTVIQYDPNTLAALNILAGSGGGTFNVLSTPDFHAVDNLLGQTSSPVVTTTLSSGGVDTVNVGNAGSVQGIVGNLAVQNPSGRTTLNVDDSADTTDKAVTISAPDITGLAPGLIGGESVPVVHVPIRETDITGLAPATVTYESLVTQGGVTSVEVRGGSGADTVNVLSTAAGMGVTIDGGGSPSGRPDRVAVGNAQRGVQDIRGGLHVVNFGPPWGLSSPTTLVLDDSADSNPVDAVLTRSGITGFAPAPITWFVPTDSWEQPAIQSLEVRGGSGADTFTVQSTMAGTQTVVSGGLGNDAINVGSAANTLDAIQGPLTILDGTDGTVSGGAYDGNTITLRDDGSAAGHDYAFSNTALARDGVAPITYGSPWNETLRLYTAAGDNRITFDGAAGNYCWTEVHDGAGSDQIDVLATSGAAFVSVTSTGGADLFRVGSAAQAPGDTAPHGGTLVNIGDGLVGYYNYAGSATCVVDDSGDTAPRTVTGAPNGLSGLSPHNVPIQSGSGLNLVYGGSGGNTFSIDPNGAPFPMQIFTGDGPDTVTFTRPWLYSYLGNFNNIHGQGGGDTLILDDQSATDNPTWSVTAAAVTRASKNPAPWDSAVTFNFDGLEHLNVNGGGGNDTFRMQAVPGTSLRLDGGGGRNALDYSAFTTGVTVDLATGTATAVAGGVRGIADVTGGSGADRLTGDATDNILRGGAGNDTLSGGEGNDILLGEAGADSLLGGSGRDLLIGGLGADVLNGGGDDDILVGGTTAYDADAAALNAVMQEWTRTDQAYAQRVSHLRLGGGLNGSTLFDAAKVTDDGSADRLTGSLGLDWFFAGLRDVLTDRAGGERVN